MEPEVIVSEDDLVIRRMRDEDADYDLWAGWRNQPHVLRYWDPDLPPSTRESVREEYGPDLLPDSVSTPCIVELGGAPIGFIQFHRWSDYAEGANEVGIPFDDRTYSLDVFIGDPAQVGRGVGTRLVTVLSDYLLRELGASEVSLTTDLDNLAAQRCYEKAGFRKIKEVLDTDTYQGQRVMCWLMAKDR